MLLQRSIKPKSVDCARESPVYLLHVPKLEGTKQNESTLERNSGGAAVVIAVYETKQEGLK